MILSLALAGVICLSQTCLADDSPIVGAWDVPSSDPDIEYGCLVFYENGQYIVYDSYCDGPDGYEGHEYGKYTHDNSTGEFEIYDVTDENGDCGLAEDGDYPGGKIFVDGDTMSFTEDDGETFSIRRLCSADTPIVGAWDHWSHTGDEYSACVFYENGKYVVYDQYEKDGNEGEGVEYGTYTHDNSTGVFSVSVEKDENWDAGFAEDEKSFDDNIVIENDTMVVNGDSQAPRVGTCDSGGSSDGGGSGGGCFVGSLK